MTRLETLSFPDGRTLSLSLLRASLHEETAFAVFYDGKGVDGLVAIIESVDVRDAYRGARSELRREFRGRPLGIARYGVGR